MSQDLFTVLEVASRLGLHVKTVRRFVREGKLKATRIGKQYRIARSDLEALTGQPIPASDRETALRHRHIEVSSIVQIDAISEEESTQLAHSLAEYVYGRAANDEPLRIETTYDRHLGRMKIILLGSVSGTGAAMKMITTLG
jgi:excisionase family DNA binding protein